MTPCLLCHRPAFRGELCRRHHVYYRLVCQDCGEESLGKECGLCPKCIEIRKQEMGSGKLAERLEDLRVLARAKRTTERRLTCHTKSTND